MTRYRDPAWRDAMRLRVDYNNMMAERLGKNGITDGEIDALAPRLAAAADALTNDRSSMKWRELPYNQAEVVEKLETVAADVRGRFDNFVVLGIGGSALGPIAVHQALCHLRYNELPREKRGGPRLYVEDNIDPERMAALLDVIDVDRTMFNVSTATPRSSPPSW